MRRPIAWIAAFLDLLHPQQCGVCGRQHAAGAIRHICRVCRTNLSCFAVDGCNWCGRPFLGGTGGRPCLTCRSGWPVGTRGWALGAYHGTLRRAILRWKQGGDPGVGRELIELLGARLRHEASFDPDVLTAVPPDPRRRHWHRAVGAADLTRWLGQITKIHHDPALLVKRATTPPQRVLARRDRLCNVSGRFALKRPDVVRGRRVLVIDDVMTTGATLKESMRALRHAGAADVWWAALAVRPLQMKNTIR